MKTLSNKVVLITGCAGGLGRALALEVARQGGIPAIADINEAGLEETATLLGQAGASTSIHPLDVRNPEAWAATAASVAARHGGIDVLMNNAGVYSRAESFIDVSLEHCQFIMDVNFWGMFHGCRAVVPYLAQRPEAHITNTASAMALIGSPMHSVYAASKAAVANFTAVLREELHNTRIGVTAVYPGATRTGLARNVQASSEAQRQENARNFERFPLRPPEKVARSVVRGLLRNDARVVTGYDGLAMSAMQRLSPETGHRSVGAFYRKVSEPGLFASLDKLR